MYAQVLIAVSLAGAAYQDVKERAVNDLVWIPALLGTGLVVYSLVSPAGPLLWAQLVKLGLVGVIALIFTLYGAVGQADAIALVFVAADPFSLSPILPLFVGAVVAMAHIAYEYGVGNARGGRKIPMAQFLREQRWIPKAVVSNGVRTEIDRDVNVAREEVEAKKDPDAMVEVSYGVPTVAYLGAGYVAFVILLLAFDPSSFFSLP